MYRQKEKNKFSVIKLKDKLNQQCTMGVNGNFKGLFIRSPV